MAGRLCEMLESRVLFSTYVVNTLRDDVGDTSTTDNLISLREAVAAAGLNLAQGDAPAGDAGHDTIRFAPSLAGKTITLSFDLTVLESMTIDGGGVVTINGNNTWGIPVSADNVTIQDLTLANSFGGAVRLQADNGLIRNVTFRGNTSPDGGALLVDGANAVIRNSRFIGNSATSAGTGMAGAIHVADGSGVSSLGIFNSTFRDNTAVLHGGAIAVDPGASLTVRNSVFSGNTTTADSSAGGGIFSDGGTVRIVHSRLTGNTANGLDPTILSSGGALNATTGSVDITDSQITANSGGAGGGIHTDSATLTLLRTRVSNNSATYGGGLQAGGVANLWKSIFSNNTAGSTGGGIYNAGTMSLGATRVFGNKTLDGGFGGGIANSSGTLYIDRGSVNNNTAAVQGGGISQLGGTMTLFGTQVIGNVAQYGGGVAITLGGGITPQVPTTTIQAARISGNRARLASDPTTAGGGGVYIDAGTLNLLDTRITANRTTGSGGGVLSDVDAVVNKTNATIAGNLPDNEASAVIN